MATPAPTAIVGSVVLIMGITELKDMAPKSDGGQDGFHMKVIIYGFMLGTALLIVAMFNPGIAKAFAYLGVIGAFVTNGVPALTAIGAIK